MDNKDKWILLECGTKAWPGDVVYNYYDMRPVILGTPRDRDIEEAKSRLTDIWVDCRIIAVGESRGTDYMNGTRLCSIDFAKRRDFRDWKLGMEAKEAQGA